MSAMTVRPADAALLREMAQEIGREHCGCGDCPCYHDAANAPERAQRLRALADWLEWLADGRRGVKRSLSDLLDIELPPDT